MIISIEDLIQGIAGSPVPEIVLKATGSDCDKNQGIIPCARTSNLYSVRWACSKSLDRCVGQLIK